MLASRLSRVSLLVVVAALLYLGSWQAGERLRAVRHAAGPIEAAVWVPTPRAGRVLSLGYNEMAADLAWARTTVYYGDGLEKKFSMASLEPLVALVNALDPHFRRPYLWGAYAVTFRQQSATLEEHKASVTILERGMAVFPQDWELAWMLGIRYYLDLKSDDPAEARRFKEMGADFIERAMRMPGAPPDLPGLAATLRTELGQKERALREMREMILTMQDDKAREALLARYERMVSTEMAAALKSAQQDFAGRWRRTLPFAPPSMFLLVGEPAPTLSPAQLLAGSTATDLSLAELLTGAETAREPDEVAREPGEPTREPAELAREPAEETAPPADERPPPHTGAPGGRTPGAPPGTILAP